MQNLNTKDPENQVWYMSHEKSIIWYLQVFKDLKADPIAPGVGDDGEAHVRRRVVEITNNIYSTFWTFGPQKRV